MHKTKSNKWIFAAKFRKRAFGWRGSRLACQRIKEAISEIRDVGAESSQLFPGSDQSNSLNYIEINIKKGLKTGLKAAFGSQKQQFKKK